MSVLHVCFLALFYNLPLTSILSLSSYDTILRSHVGPVTFAVGRGSASEVQNLPLPFPILALPYKTRLFPYLRSSPSIHSTLDHFESTLPSSSLLLEFLSNPTSSSFFSIFKNYIFTSFLSFCVCVVSL
jgi:hypothetical protein